MALIALAIVAMMVSLNLYEWAVVIGMAAVFGLVLVASLGMVGWYLKALNDETIAFYARVTGEDDRVVGRSVVGAVKRAYGLDSPDRPRSRRLTAVPVLQRRQKRRLVRARLFARCWISVSRRLRRQPESIRVARVTHSDQGNGR
jgi:hypothetical protein